MTDPFLPGWLTAMQEAWDGYLYGSYPIGACIVDSEGKVVGRGRNRLGEPRRAHAGVIGGHDLAHAEINALRSEEERARFNDGWGSTPSDALHSPARRARRALTPDQQAREEYQRYVSAQYLQALDECKTAVLNSRGRAAGINEYDLFSGPEHTARAYASEELQAWWRRNGRLTASAFRYHLLGRDSDRAAAVRAGNADFNNAA